MEATATPVRALHEQWFVRDILDQARPRTIDEHRFSLTFLCKMLVKADEGGRCDIDGEPPISFGDAGPLFSDLTPTRLHRLRRAALDSDLAATTVAKHFRHIRKYLKCANLRFEEMGSAFGVRYNMALRSVKVPEQDAPAYIPGDVLREMYDAASVATLPKEDPAGYWQCFLVTAYNTGFRKYPLQHMPWTAVDLKQSLIRCPASLDKKSRGRVKPINQTVIEHLKLRRPVPGSARHAKIHNFPYGDGAWYRQWNQITGAVGVDYRPHDLKRTLATELRRMRAPDWARHLLLDHAFQSVEEVSYANTEETVDALREFVDLVPQPWGGVGRISIYKTA